MVLGGIDFRLTYSLQGKELYQGKTFENLAEHTHIIRGPNCWVEEQKAMPGYLAGEKAPPHGSYSYLSVCDQILYRGRSYKMIRRSYQHQGNQGKDPK